jgi:hypothetical protein
MSMEWDNVSELRPPTGLFFIPHILYENREQRYNDTDRVNPKNSEENQSQCHFSHHKYHMN